MLDHDRFLPGQKAEGSDSDYAAAFNTQPPDRTGIAGDLRIIESPAELRLCGGPHNRKNWLFVGSDEHAEVTATIVSLVASCKLHKLDPEHYLRDLARLLPTWPKTRVLELAPKYWRATRARLDVTQLDARLGLITIPPREAQAEQT